MSFEKVPNFLGKFFVAEMNDDEHRFFRFNSFLLDAAECQLRRGEDSIPLTPKAFGTLVYLVKKGGHLVTKDELMAEIWPDSFVDEGNIPRTIHTIRKALGEDQNGNKFIETVPTKGYRFVAGVETITGRPDVFGDETVDNDDRTDISLVRSDPAILIEPTAETGKRRHFLVLAAALFLVVLVTGFWISNGSLLPLAAGVPRHSANGEAYRHFQQGKFLLEERTIESFQQALQHFEAAIQIDPAYAEAYVGEADVRSTSFNGALTHDDITSARAAVKKALELDENNSYAETILCRITGTYEWEFDQAVTECQRAVMLAPNDNETHRELGFALNVVGQTDEALAEMNAAVSLSPTSFNKRSLAMVLYMSRHYDEAIEQFDQVQATDPNYTETEKWLVSCFVMKGDYANAFTHLIKMHKESGANDNDINAANAAFMSGGWPAALRLTLDSSSGIGKRKTFWIAAMFAQIGEKDKAFDILNDVHKRRALMLITVARDPLLDPLREDPRYETILSQMKLK